MLHMDHVRFGSLADICSAIGHVGFTPESGHPAVDRRGARVFAANCCRPIAARPDPARAPVLYRS